MLHIKYFLKDLKQTGAILPSSRYLAKDAVEILKKKLDKRDSGLPVKVLEIGPGTGIFSGYIQDLLLEEDQFDLVELNINFYELLSKRFQQPNVCVHNCDILEYEPEYTYDYIFSSVPYETLPSVISKKIWMKKLNLCHGGSHITYYKYINFNRFRCKFEKEVVRQYQTDNKVVFLNVPPAKLFTLEITDDKYQTEKVVAS